MKKFNKKKERMGSIDYVVFFTVIILLVIGIIMVYSSSSYYSLYHNGSSTTFLKKELFAATAGIAAMLFFMCFDYHKLKNLSMFPARRYFLLYCFFRHKVPLRFFLPGYLMQH